LDGAVSDDGRIWGCYLHGIFDNDVFRRAWLASLGLGNETCSPGFALDDALDRLADVVEETLDMHCLDRIIAEAVTGPETAVSGLAREAT
jgi:adenosylcobyric acid synthase